MEAVFHPCSDRCSSLSAIGAERPLSGDGRFNGGGSHGDGEGERRSGETRGRRRLGENAAALGQHGECVALYNLTHTPIQNIPHSYKTKHKYARSYTPKYTHPVSYKINTPT